MTVIRDGNIVAVWRLCSDVDEEAPQHCCWEIVDPVHVLGYAFLSPAYSKPIPNPAGASRPFKRNGRYGGVCPRGQADVTGFITIVFRLKLGVPSEEGLTVYEGGSEFCCVVWRS